MSTMIVPSLRYRDAKRALEWLHRAFGFEKHAVYENPDGTVTLVGTLTLANKLRAAAVRLDAQHKVVTEDGWPFWAPGELFQGSGALDGSMDELGGILPPRPNIWSMPWGMNTNRPVDRS